MSLDIASSSTTATLKWKRPSASGATSPSRRRPLLRRTAESSKLCQTRTTTIRLAWRGDPDMLTLHNGRATLLCHRRVFLRVGRGLAWAGISLPESVCANTTSAKTSTPANGARSCILVYLLGGPPHLDMWDLKPVAPDEVRGPFRPIATSIPGIQFCEHM